MSLGNAKYYYIYDSNSDIVYDNVFSLSAFCKQYNLNESCMRDISRGKGKTHRGWFCKPIENKHLIENDIQFIRYKKINNRFSKIKKTFSKRIRYSQSKDFENFQNNIDYFYQVYHIEQQLSCSEIEKLIDRCPKDTVAKFFKSKNLKIYRYNNPNKGKNHPRYRSLDETQKHFLNNFKEIFTSLHFDQKKSITEIALLYGLTPTTICNYCRKHQIEFESSNISYPHRLLLNWLDEHNIKTEKNVRSIIPPKEIDIFLPDYNIAIEINGIFWHSNDKIEKNYHLNKTKFAIEKNIQLIHLWDVEILEKFDIIKSIILNKMSCSNKIYGRDTVIKEIDNNQIQNFLKENHIQGARNSKINYGLFYKNQLISVMSFNRHKKYQYEMIRFCNKINFHVIGGANKLFKQFISQYNPIQTVSYCDIRLFNGRVYENLGFKLIHCSNPNYWYFNKNKFDGLHSRLQFQKHKLEKKLKIFNRSKSEYQNMKDNGYEKIYDCGNKVFIWNA